MTAAMTLNLVLSAIAGVLIPLTMIRLGRDPALGSSVLITAITDSGGVFLFLGFGAPVSGGTCPRNSNANGGLRPPPAPHVPLCVGPRGADRPPIRRRPTPPAAP